MRKPPLSVLLELIGLIIISLLSLSLLGKNLFFVKRQAVYIAISFVIMYFMLYFDFKDLKYVSWLLYLIGLILLVSVFFLGKSTYGAQRWIHIGGLITIQPSEFEKPILIVFFAYVVIQKLPQFKKFLYIITTFSIPFVLIFKEPDFGTDMVLFSIFLFVILFFFNLKYFFYTFTSVILSIPIVIKFLKPYQIQRIAIFLYPSKDPLGAGYNVLQSIIAVGSGGLFGRGFGKSILTKLHFVPVQYADFIFSAIGETFGFIGIITLLLLYVGLLIFIIRTYTLVEDKFGKAILIGIFALFITQIFINIGMCIGIMPVTGIPLPFVSYGGSAMISNFIIIGLAINIYVYREEINLSL